MAILTNFYHSNQICLFLSIFQKESELTLLIRSLKTCETQQTGERRENTDRESSVILVSFNEIILQSSVCLFAPKVLLDYLRPMINQTWNWSRPSRPALV